MKRLPKPAATPLLFKLHWPDNYIVGGGFFASFSKLPVSIVWATFGLKNGGVAGQALQAIRRAREPLHLELRGGVFQVVARPRVGRVVMDC